jgi:azurin
MRALYRLLVLAACAALPACVTEAPPRTPEQEAVFAEPVDVELVVPGVANAMRFAVERIEAPAGSRVRLVMDNASTTSPAMRHNVVVLRDAAAAERVGTASARAAGFVADDPAVLVATPLAGPREAVAVVFTMPPPGEYLFLCTYPGHWRAMQGVLVSTVPAQPAQ